MKTTNVYIAGTNCITPLGFDVESNVLNILNGNSGIRLYTNTKLLATPFHAGIVDDDKLEAAFTQAGSSRAYTRLEKMMILALKPIITRPVADGRSVLIVSTTKGNITAIAGIDNVSPDAYLGQLAENISGYFGFTTQPVVVSNACVSGILAVSVAKRLLQSGMYDNAFVVSGDEVTEFVLSGFSSFQAMSDEPCKPYSAHRNGVTLGEAAAAALITTDKEGAIARITGDSSINDANHISGPSRTGEGLYRSVTNALNETGVKPEEVDYISAHGTATVFNDEMEAIAFNRAGLAQVSLNSFKGYYGHTLGASGLLEAVIGLESMKQNRLFASLGYDEPGVSQRISVITGNSSKTINYFLKTASGFGGCNTAVLFKKIADGN